MRKTALLVVFVTLTLLSCGTTNEGDDAKTAIASSSSTTTASTTTASTLAAETSAPAKSTTTTTARSTTTTLPSPVQATFAPAWDSFELFLRSWEGAATSFNGEPGSGLAPTIGPADVRSVDGQNLFAEIANEGPVLGGVVDPATGQVIAVLGMVDPDSGYVTEALGIPWITTFGLLELDSLSTDFDPDAVLDMVAGDHLRTTRDGKTVLLQFINGVQPNDGFYLFTIADDERFATDPDHREIIEPLMDQLAQGLIG